MTLDNTASLVTVNALMESIRTSGLSDGYKAVFYSEANSIRRLLELNEIHANETAISLANWLSGECTSWGANRYIDLFTKDMAKTFVSSLKSIASTTKVE